jgi:hypothetical protein
VPHDFESYSQEEFEKELERCDVVLAFQKQLSQELGHAVTLSEVEDIVYGLSGTVESRTEELRRK